MITEDLSDIFADPRYTGLLRRKRTIGWVPDLLLSEAAEDFLTIDPNELPPALRRPATEGQS